MIAAEKNIEHLLHLLEKNLENKKFLVGDKLSIADIAIMSFFIYLFRCHYTQEFRKKFPNMTRWYESVAAVPEVIKYYGRSYEPKESWLY